MELDQQLKDITTNLATFQAKAQEDIKANGAIATETKAALENLTTKLTAAQTQLDAIDLKMTKRFVDGPAQAKSLGDSIVESEEFLEAKEHGFSGKRPVKMHLKSGLFERKTNITASGLGSGTGGVVARTMLATQALFPMQGFRLRDLLTVRELTTGNAFDWIRQTTRTIAASPQVEASAKAESTSNWDVQSGTVKTIAHFMNVTRQALDDVPWLRQAMDNDLRYGLTLKEEQEILSGDGTGEHLNGILTQATAYLSATYDNVSSYTRLDQLRHAKLQARLSGLATYAPDGMVLHPADMAEIELIKDETGGAHRGRYIIGDPKDGTELKVVWGLPVVESDTIAQGTFLVGSFSRAAELIDRMAVSIEISYEHASNFTSNLATVLCEERVGLAVMRPGAFIKGTFASSPA